MNKSVKLTVLLLMQVGLAFFLLNREEPTASFVGKEALLSDQSKQADRLEISLSATDDQAAQSLSLIKKDGQWLLPSYYQFPAAAGKISDLFSSLADLKKSWPVGKTMIAAKQFKVGRDNFERSIAFYEGDKLVQTLYLGSSPSFKKIHARVDDEDLTYSVPLSLFEVPTEATEWQDQDYLSQSRAKIKKLSMPEFTLDNDGGDFVVLEPGEGQETDKAKTSAFMSKLAKPHFDRVVGDKSAVELGESKLSYTLELEDGQAQTLTYYVAKSSESAAVASEEASGEDEKLLLVSSRHPYGFEVSANRVAVVLNATKSQFLKSSTNADGDEKSGEVKPIDSSTEAGDEANAALKDAADLESMADAVKAMSQEDS